MGQVRHGSATTTHAVRAAIQRSQASVAQLAERYGLNPKTVRKWRHRASVEDEPMGPKAPRSTVLSVLVGNRPLVVVSGIIVAVLGLLFAWAKSRVHTSTTSS